jgi:hypothetical protein
MSDRTTTGSDGADVPEGLGGSHVSIPRDSLPATEDRNPSRPRPDRADMTSKDSTERAAPERQDGDEPFTRTDVPDAPDDPTDPPVTDGPVNSA